MKRDNLNTMFGNINNAAEASHQNFGGFDGAWTQIRAEFSAKARGQKAEVVEEEESVIPEEFHFLSIKSPCKTINTWIFYWILGKIILWIENNLQW